MLTSTATSIAHPQCIRRTDLPLIFRSWRPAHHEILVCELANTSARIVKITDRLDGIFINAINGKELYRYSLNLGSTILYGVASHVHIGKYYIVREHDLTCSCWQYRTGGACQCVDEVRQHIESMEVQYAALA